MKNITTNLTLISLILISFFLFTGCGKVNGEDFLQDTRTVLDQLAELHEGTITEEQFRTQFDTYTDKYSGKLSQSQQEIYINVRQAYSALMEAKLCKLLGKSGEAEVYINDYLNYAEKVKALL